MPFAKNSERGAAMMITMVIFIMSGLSMAMDLMMAKSTRVRSDQRAMTTLAEAKQALIAYAVLDANSNHGDAFGLLPCPSLGDLVDYTDPAAPYTEFSCYAGPDTAIIGFFPWNVLDLPPLRDGENAPIWLAIHTGFMAALPGVLPDCVANTYLQLSLNGGAASGNYAAVLISPGASLPSQSRIPTQNANTLQSAFLDRGNTVVGTNILETWPQVEDEEHENPADGNPAVTTTYFNDRLLTISCDEIADAVAKL